MKNLFLTVVFFCSILISNAQISFYKNIEPSSGSNSMNYIRGITSFSDKTIYQLTELDSQTNAVPVVIKSDSTGSVIWGKAYLMGSPATGLSRRLIRTSDGNLLFTGNYSLRQPFGSFITLVKTDTSGNIMWNRCVTTGSLSSIKETMDGGFILGAYRQDSIHFSPYFLEVIKLDDGGNTEWCKVFASPGGNPAIIQTDDGGYLLSSDSLLTKLDIAGLPVRSFILSDSYGQITSFIQVNPNGYMMAFPDRQVVCYVDSSANMKWIKQLYNYNTCFDLLRLNDSTVMMGGSGNVNQWPAVFSQKIDTSGNCFQYKGYKLDTAVFAECISAFPDNRFLFGGHSYNWWTQHDGSYMVLTDTDAFSPCGIDTVTGVATDLIENPVPYVLSCLTHNLIDTIDYVPVISIQCYDYDACISVTAVKESNREAIQLFPNPASSFFRIVSNNLEKTHIEIFNLTGELIYSASFSGQSPDNYRDVDCRLFPPGIYFVKLQSEKETSVQKLIIQ
jgi:hypothetical protein